VKNHAFFETLLYCPGTFALTVVRADIMQIYNMCFFRLSLQWILYIPQSLMHRWCLSTSLTTSGIYLSRILPFLPKVREVTIFGGIDQITALATYRSSSLIQLNVLSWIDASIDILHETYFPNLEFLTINLYQETTTVEIIRIERTIEQSFAHLPNLISLHYYSLMTTLKLSNQINMFALFF